LKEHQAASSVFSVSQTDEELLLPDDDDFLQARKSAHRGGSQ
jgi:hypothetical protein